VVHLSELTVEECWELVEGQRVARIGWNGSSGPVVLPINYISLDRTVWMRTAAHSSIAEEVDEMVVAVEIDQIDPDTHVGWSVLLRGHADIAYREENVPEEVRGHRTWPSGPRPLWVHLTPNSVTGRRLSED